MFSTLNVITVGNNVPAPNAVFCQRQPLYDWNCQSGVSWYRSCTWPFGHVGLIYHWRAEFSCEVTVKPVIILTASERTEPCCLFCPLLAKLLFMKRISFPLQAFWRKQLPMITCTLSGFHWANKLYPLLKHFTNLTLIWQLNRNTLWHEYTRCPKVPARLTVISVCEPFLNLSECCVMACGALHKYSPPCLLPWRVVLQPAAEMHFFCLIYTTWLALDVAASSIMAQSLI